MRFVCHPVCSALLPIMLLSSIVWSGSFGNKKDKAAVPTIRWAEGKTGCTFTRGEDGKYRYGLWAEELGITLAVDSQELQKVRRRPEPMFSGSLILSYRGAGKLAAATHSSLEF